MACRTENVFPILLLLLILIKIQYNSYSKPPLVYHHLRKKESTCTHTMKHGVKKKHF